MMIFRRNAFAALLALGYVSAECPNACSGHGQCGSHDMCTCERNWQGADCSLRTCPFGLAHVDTPKGDLDASNAITDAATDVITGSTVYPLGTTEAYPKMADTTGTVLPNTAHAYMECSNKGKCSRETGMCNCMKGYDGVSCQRASCPGTPSPYTRSYGSSERKSPDTTTNSGLCSGHGTCESIAELSALDNNNVYELWDKDLSMGCKCDPGYTGADCFDRMCKYGIDPLYVDDETTRVTKTVVRIESTVTNAIQGEYSLRFFDVHGEDYLTKPISISGADSTHCTKVTNALKSLPDGVVKDVECTMVIINSSYGVEYTLTFISNPGNLKQLQIEQNLDGSTKTLSTTSGTYTSVVYNKVTGEFVDYFPTKCVGITVKVLADSADSDNTWTTANVRPGSIGYLHSPSGAFTTAQANILKKCLGDSDTNSDNNIDVQNWDPAFVHEASGSTPDIYKMIGAFPHVIKVVPVPSTTGYDQFTSGDYHLVWYDSTASAGKEFRVANLNSEANDLGDVGDEMHVYTTTGIVQQLGYGAETTSQLSSYESGAYTPESFSSTRIVGYFDAYSNRVYTNYDTSCENQPSSGAKNHKCVEKGDKLFIIDGCWGKGDKTDSTTNPFFGGIDPTDSCADSLATSMNHDTGNMYTVTRVYTVPAHLNTTSVPTSLHDYDSSAANARYVNSYVIEVDANIGWVGTTLGDPENSNTGQTGATWSDNTGIVTLFHFTPPTTTGSSYEYVSQCSNRGNCASTTGLCKCYRGYTGGDCSIQNVLAGFV